MTHPEKIKYMEIASNLCRLHFTNEQLDILVSLYELVIEKKGNADMKDVATVEAKVKSRVINDLKRKKK